ncbi:MAG: hypothetical protein K0S61_1097 [Anaerocolumna sp.]|jgi:cyclic lactone autoinducer peptide|nr:hypothetical protein [Anaerocolumna sp.]
MKLKNKSITKQLLKGINCTALALVALSANIACVWVFHQPEFPKAADRFKKLK